MFGAFEQAEGFTNRIYGGTGLGLAISKRIVEMMNGQIWVESDLGKGAKFIFTVQLERCEGPEITTGDNDTTGIDNFADDTLNDVLNGKRLLVVEDVAINREILISLLDGSGLIIECAENGREALDMIKSDPDKYDIVFMDLQMPEMGGLEASRFIRPIVSKRHKRMPIIAMTANVFKDDIDACFEAGMDDHLGKPLEIDKVFEKLRKFLREN